MVAATSPLSADDIDMAPSTGSATPMLYRGGTELVSILGGNRLAIRHGPSTHVLDWDDVVCVRSAKKCTWIVTTRGEYKVLEALFVLVECLETLGLVRIHRAVAVSRTRVRQLLGRGRHRLTIVLDTGARFDVGRQYQAAIRGHFGARTRRPLARRDSA